MTNNNWQEFYLESVKKRAALNREINELRSQVLEALKLRRQRDDLLGALKLIRNEFLMSDLVSDAAIALCDQAISICEASYD